MNLKNVNFIEKHIEKMIISVGALITLIVLFFFVVRSYTVEIDGKQTSASKIEDSVDESVKNLRKALSDTITPPELQIPVAPYTDRFRRRDQSAQRVALLVQPMGAAQGLDPNDLKFTEPILSEYRFTTIPAPQNQVARADFAVLKSNKELEVIYADSILDQIIGERLEAGDMDYGQHIADRFMQVVADEQPRDFEYVSAMAEFDWEDWERAMEGVPEGDRIPKEWWQGQYLIADVVLERQVQNPRSGAWGGMVDGQWQADRVTQVKPLPGALSFRQPHEALKPHEIKSLLRTESVQDQIVRPMFCPIEGVWITPDEHPRQRNAVEERRLLRVNKEISDLENQLRKLEKRAAQESEKQRKLADSRGVQAAAKQERLKQQMVRGGRQTTRKVGAAAGGRRRGGGALGGVMGGALGAGGLGGLTDDGGQGLQNTKQKKETRLVTLYQERENLLFDVDTTGTEDAADGSGTRKTVNPQMLQRARRRGGAFAGVMGGALGPGGLGIGGGLGAGFNPGFGNQFPNPQQKNVAELAKQNKRVTVWAHDITATPGKTYRYRLRVAVLNPLYQRDARLVMSQKHLAENLGMLSEPTDWTEPIHIHPKTYFFLVNGTRRDQEGIVEVYRVFNGKWRRHDFAVRLGEPIGGLRSVRTRNYEREVDLSVGAIVVDVDPDARSSAWGNRTTIKLVFLDLQSNQLMHRTVEQDKADEMRIYLRNQSELEDEMAEMARSTPR